ncbi:MAG: nucleoside/nucleotide kinase family protein [Oscillospiraceae bacterium]|nr:nucleoside/nucleotide kinase family protein [Oscillospiraceae bacterium]
MYDEKTTYNFNVNSFDIKAEYYKRDIDDIFIPLVRRFDKMKQNAGRRIIVYIAGPCGAGKTTISLMLESLANIHTDSSAQAVGIDGFHYNNDYLNSHYVCKNGTKVLLHDIKGSAETYNFEKLYDKITALKYGDIYWSGYDRVIHDVVDDVIFINGQIVIIEGNWLLLDEPCWRDLAQFCDYSVFITAVQETLINRLTERKIKGGLGEEGAKEFVMRSDAENIKRILSRRLKCDMELHMKEDGRFIICGN